MNDFSSSSVVVDAMFEDTQVPARATAHSSGFDLHAHVSGRTVKRCRSGEAPREAPVEGDALVLEPGERALVPLGFRARLPEGHEAQVRIRSSAAFRKGLVMPNAPGTIDADYPDEWMVMVRNDAGMPVTIAHGERIAQAVIARFESPAWVPGAVGRTTDRAGGFGSTGTH